MTRDELQRHNIGAHGRNYSLSDDGWDDMDVAERSGWRTIPSWGLDGWDLGEWPFVIVMTRERGGKFQMQQTCEGDHTVYEFASAEERDAAIDYLFVWYGLGRGYADWAAEGLGATWSDAVSDYQERYRLDRGLLRVPERFRGPFSWARLEASKAEPQP